MLLQLLQQNVHECECWLTELSQDYIVKFFLLVKGLHIEIAKCSNRRSHTHPGQGFQEMVKHFYSNIPN